MSRIQGENRFYNLELLEKYTQDSGVNLLLNTEEREWLTQHGTIRVGYLDNYLAYCDQDERNGELTGALKDYLEKVQDSFPNIEIGFATFAYPTAEKMLDALNSGEVDCVFPANFSDYDGETMGVVLTPALTRAALYTVVKPSAQKDFADKEQVTVAVASGDSNYDAILMDLYPDWQTVSCKDIEDCLKAVSNGLADCFLISSYRYNSIRKLCEKYKLTSLDTGKDISFCMAVNEGDREKDSETEERGLREGASDFIRKPFHQDILLRRIHNTIENSKTIESLSEEASKDKLTGFLNKAKGIEAIGELCRTKNGALMILDLDNFKLVNDIYGHDMGDQVLKAFAEIVKNHTEAGDVVSRIGGDEFLGFFCSRTDDASISVLTKQLNEELVQRSKALMGEDFDIPIGISTGIALAPEHSSDYTVLFQYADSSLYKVKKNGKHGYAVYSPDSTDEEEGESLEEDLLRLSKICGERNSGDGAFLLGQDAFSWNYRLIMRLVKQCHGEATKLLFQLTKKESTVDMGQAASQLAELLQNTFRKSDIILQSRSNQFFVLLPALLGETITDRIDQILSSWEQTEYHGHVEIRYVTETVSFADGQGR